MEFSDFWIERVDQGNQLLDARENLQTEQIFFDDWVLTKKYGGDAPAIAEDAEILLFLLRLFKPSELCFARLGTKSASGGLIQFPYRVISPLNSHGIRHYKLKREEIATWEDFRQELLQAPGWNSPWAQMCRRFFLYGTSIEFNPKFRDLDRILDYMVALEAALVAENDFVSARLKQRALALLRAESNLSESSAKEILNKLYSVRSTVAHGDTISDNTVQYLEQNRVSLESIVRQVLRLAILKIPADNDARRAALDKLFAIADEKRADNIVQQFK
ncbi:MAG: hypothetical protein ACRD19_06410, partial [Terriglobia bacterium]